MDLEPLGQQVGGGLVARCVGDAEHPADGAGHGLMALHQLLHHGQGGRDPFGFGNAGEAAVGGPAVGGWQAKGTDAFGDGVEGGPEFGVLPHEHQVQGVEHRPGDIPVEAMGLGVEHGGIGQHLAQPLGDLLALGCGDADVDGGGAAGGHGELGNRGFNLGPGAWAGSLPAAGPGPDPDPHSKLPM